MPSSNLSYPSEDALVPAKDRLSGGLTPATLLDRLAFADDREHGPHVALVSRIGAEGEHRSFTFGDLAVAAKRAAGGLTAQGARPKDRVALLLPHTPTLVHGFLGAIFGGFVPSILAWPTAKMDPEKYRRNVHAVVRRLGARFVVTEPRMAADLGASLGDARVLDAQTLIEGRESDACAHHRTLDETLFIQFSGGTTGTQKSVPIDTRRLHRQLHALSVALGDEPDDRVISWLPLYHDMGLVACLLFPFVRRIPVTMFAPMEWVMDPGRFLAAVGTDRATLCWLPNFAFRFMAKRARVGPEVNLDSLRRVVSCSEPVRADCLDAFAERFAACGLRQAALHTSYAMAESTFAVTQSTDDAPPRRLRVSRADLGSGRVVPDEAGERVLVSSGRPIPDVEVTIASDDPATRVGEILLRGPFLMAGYLDVERPERAAAISPDGFYATGDLGVLRDGHLYVTGRAKDVVIIGGVNVFPEDVEHAVSDLPGIHAGRVVALGLEDESLGTERLVVVAEADSEAALSERDALESAIRRETLLAAGVAASEVFVVPPRWIVKSTAGKIARRETRERVLEQWERLTAREERDE